MSKGNFGPPARLRGPDYEQIEAAVMETARGRWFLAEYARRNRTADTELLLRAIERLQNVVAGEENRSELSEMRASLLDMAAAIARLRRELFSENDDTHGGRAAPQELDAIVIETEQATHKILRIGERVQEIAWNLREQGVRATICDALDSSASDIFAACSFQDLTGQKMARVVALLRMIEERLDTVIDRNGLEDLVLRSTPAGMAREDEDPAGTGRDAPEARGPGRTSASQREIDDLLTPDGRSQAVEEEDEDGQYSGPADDGAPRESVVIEIDDPELEIRDVAPAESAASTGRAPAVPLPPVKEPDSDTEMNLPAPGAGEDADGDDDLANFDRLSAELEAAASPASGRAHGMVAPGDIAFAGDEDATGIAAGSGHDEPQAPIAAGAAAEAAPSQSQPMPDRSHPEAEFSSKAGGPRGGNPAQTGWDAEFNRLSPAHRMALFS